MMSYSFLAKILLVFSALLSMVVWLAAPIFPDEVAFHFTSARYLQDGGIAQKLFYLCNGNSRITPEIFLLPAIFLSHVYMKLSYVELRVISLLIILYVFAACIFYKNKKNSVQSTLQIFVGLIGVAGSGMVMARYEHWQLLLICICLTLLLIKPIINPLYKIILMSLLLFTLVNALYVHIQTLLFLPLTIFTIYYLIADKKIITKALLVCLSTFFVYKTITFHQLNCDEYIGIKKSIDSMTFKLSVISLERSLDWVINHGKIFINAFLYNEVYKINYLPGLKIDNLYIKIINFLIKFALIVNSILFFYIFSKSFIHMMCNKFSGLYSCRDNLNSIVFLVGTPIIFLFIYDENQNFYRSFFINLLSSLVVFVYLTKNKLISDSFLITYSSSCFILFLVSICLNFYNFLPKFIDGYEGPSISVFSTGDVNNNVLRLMSNLRLESTEGNIIVDDLTYSALKNNPRLYPITYLDFSSGLSGLSSIETINKIGANYIIARCSYINSWKLTPQFRVDNICAIDLSTYLER